MPSGVEHIAHEAAHCRQYRLDDALMPSGVEHAAKGAHKGNSGSSTTR